MLRQQSTTAGWHNPSVVSIVQIPTKDTLKHIQRIQTFTIAWMSVEAALSLWAAWTARSPALAAFGGDSTVELLSAVVVLWRFRTHASERAEQVAARIAGGLLFALAAYVVLASAMSLLGYNEPLTMVGLAERAQHFPSQMSGGQQQRVAIARALVNRPSILLADEPTGNLDSRTSVEIMEILQNLNDQGLTIVLVTHEHDIAQFAKRVLVFRDGRIRKDDPVLSRPSAREALKTLPTLED